jgi:galactokinase/mevalonate kinase-like predicted kinase
MAEALRRSDLPAVGILLSENWRLQQLLDQGMRSEPMARLEAAMAAAGILGGKAVGAGAGGSMIFLAAGNSDAAAQAARLAGARVLPFSWAAEGVRLG